ncbi:MAG TPA: succinate CoA transferase [Blastocatellia bacterium]|nr:succinate CoA transferase [Blastocatellia bacterium]
MKHNGFVEARLMSAEDAAAMLPEKGTIATSGFTNAYPKVIPAAYAKRIHDETAQGREFAFNLFTGASTGEELDGVLARTGAVRKRLPYQSTPDMRDRINRGEIEFLDMHLSHVPNYISHGILDPIDVAIVEAVDVTTDGRIYLSMSAGITPTYIHHAREVFIELNEFHPRELKGYHDIFVPDPPPHGRPIHIVSVDDRVGVPYVACDPDKIRGIVLTNLSDSNPDYRQPDDVSVRIAEHVLEFILHEVRRGRVPKSLLPFQSGVGNVANAVLACMAHSEHVSTIRMYTEVIQDSIFDLIDADKLEFASTSALTFSQKALARFHNEIDELRRKFVIRPQEISNNPEVIRRMGIISMNTALEVDIFGHVNSTHVMGSRLMNGIGGSGDFTRNAYISIFLSPSVAKGGAISSFVPMVSHVDHVEHSTQIIVSEWGLADLRGLAPVARARQIIARCAHPDYRDMLTDYLDRSLETAYGKHLPHDLKHVFDWHTRFIETGTMKAS